MRRYWRLLGISALLLFPKLTHAHEAYVLTRDEFENGLQSTTLNPLGPLLNGAYLGVSAIITVVVALTYLASIIWSATPIAGRIDRKIKKLAVVGPLIIRLAIGSALFYGAIANAIFGPELPLGNFGWSEAVRFVLFVISLMMLAGFLTELAALVGLGLFGYAALVYGGYMATYANYFGELVVLAMFGSRFISIDKYLFGDRLWLKNLTKLTFLEVPIVRVMYGIGLIYAGWTIKFVHQGLTVNVYDQYHLYDFFHASGDFIASGAGLSEILIGLFIVLGFAQRLTIIISLVFITLSLFYFREMIWPHLMLYGISFSLLINSGDRYTLDRYLPMLVKKIFGKK